MGRFESKEVLMDIDLITQEIVGGLESESGSVIIVKNNGREVGLKSIIQESWRTSKMA
jgi:hypothetical protein